MLEAFIYLGWARVLKTLPFSRIAPSLGGRMSETPLANDPSNEMPIRQIAQAIRVVSRHTIWESQCMVRAIAAKKMLKRRQIESTLYLGTARDDQGNMIAHAWLRSGPFYVTGAEEMKMFTMVAAFGSDKTQGKE
ncbi:lasso peptide biosynthesis B2 protein [Paenibacillus lignilyticus]|uniref:Lasso peptide biosynthesis B2 protein n=1 Tax=Paenibacillus lignilyticus TaxID=1172615 RepID=A0ABS5C730_9BACL|nr:lasso peptide biosynthesis B2 protein [Paenibacillus lignilyticus]MBP3961799.1 lasso peptide biosynthesis B2 protein [Paenibacillus lignilyticus]MBP3963530.1 lasso peptide biosynthesis B2 protein [Paenibacillus lignilyticus]